VYYIWAGRGCSWSTSERIPEKKDKKITPSLRAALLEHLNQRKDSTKKKEKTMK
jgi:hypothetical protein